MSGRRRIRPRPATAVAALSLVAALAGTAIADPNATSSANKLNKKQKKQVKSISKQEADKQIDARAPDLSVDHANTADAANTANTADAASNASQLGGTPASGFLRTSADTVGNSGFDSSCDPSSTTFVDCATLTIGTARQGRFLINAEAPFGVDSNAPGTGTCRVQVDEGIVPDSTVRAGLEVASAFGDDANVGIGVTVVTDLLAAGVHTVTLQCNETDADIDFNDLSVSALSIGPAP